MSHNMEQTNERTKPLRVTPELYSYILSHTGEPEVLKQCREETYDNKNLDAIMQISPDEGRFLSVLTRITHAKKVVEVGVFTGYSSLSIGMHLPDDGKIFALDISKEYTDIAKKYWDCAGITNKIDLRLGSAVDSLNKLLVEGHANSIDIFFIDADKENYDNYYEAALKLVKIGGIIVVDNVLWYGRVIDPNNNRFSTVAIRNINDKMVNDDRVMTSMLGFADGIALAIRIK